MKRGRARDQDSWRCEDYQGLRATEATGFVALGALPGNPTCQVLGSSFDQFFTLRPPMSADGSVVVGNCIKTDAGTALGFRWSERAGLIALEPLPGDERTNATSVSPDGIVGGTSTGADGSEGVLWDEDGVPRSIPALLEAAGVDLGGFSIDDDVIVLGGGRLLYGSGHDAAGAGRTWVALLP